MPSFSINQMIKQSMLQFYKMINTDLEYIINSPSTVNKIFKYYQIGYNINEPTKRYLMFGDKIVRIWEMEYVSKDFAELMRNAF